MIWRKLWARRTLTEIPVSCGGSKREGSAGAKAGSAGVKGGRAGTTLVVREPEAQWWAEPARSTMTVAALHEDECLTAAADRLAPLAAEDELLVVLGTGRPEVRDTVVRHLRLRLPRHDVVGLTTRPGNLLRDAATVECLLDHGSLPVVVTGAENLFEVTAAIASYLRADRVLRTVHTAWERRRVSVTS
ncbi:hypothetical protein JIG36_00090 [Actinoplanes sp. LDG1-06]|uniref:Uncharacterized protein n=1 Tax=Paractinoplanes ovalisporus TaxID=2810368 RepID=A0ABS2A290_9ACTN|nr:hypothetical protein [Actinoplanes ovalisporus]MBM2613953.1 hypothetical protein [Actinoplanes ovalisporus]